MLTVENKNNLDDLLAMHEMTSHLLAPTVSDAAMLATVAKMGGMVRTRWRYICFTTSNPMRRNWQRIRRKRVSRKSTLTNYLAICSAEQQKLGGEIHRVFLYNFHKTFLAVRWRTRRTEFLSIVKLHNFSTDYSSL